jgi:hypothetical protein
VTKSDERGGLRRESSGPSIGREEGEGGFFSTEEEEEEEKERRILRERKGD